MPHVFLHDFVVIIVSVLFLSAFALLLTIRISPRDTPDYGLTVNDADQVSEPEKPADMTEKLIEHEPPPAPSPLLQVPHMSLPGAKLGGGAKEENFSKAVGAMSLSLKGGPNEKRKYNRRMRDRRESDIPIDNEKRLVQRRVWLRREEDHSKMKLLTVSEAADTLETSVEQIYKWLGNADIPFYQITEGKRRVIRFEINELLQWYNTFVMRNDTSKSSP